MKFSKIVMMTLLLVAVSTSSVINSSSYWSRAKAKAQEAADKAKTSFNRAKESTQSAYQRLSDKVEDLSDAAKLRYYELTKKYRFKPSNQLTQDEIENMNAMAEYARQQGIGVGVDVN